MAQIESKSNAPVERQIGSKFGKQMCMSQQLTLHVLSTTIRTHSSRQLVHCICPDYLELPHMPTSRSLIKPLRTYLKAEDVEETIFWKIYRNLAQPPISSPKDAGVNLARGCGPLLVKSAKFHLQHMWLLWIDDGPFKGTGKKRPINSPHLGYNGERARVGDPANTPEWLHVATEEVQWEDFDPISKVMILTQESRKLVAHKKQTYKKWVEGYLLQLHMLAIRE